MGKIIDLNIFESEALEFKGTDGEIYTIPSTISTNFVIKFQKYFEDVQKIKTDEKALVLMKKLVVDILNLDKTKNVDIDHIEKYFDDIRILRLIVEKTMEYIKEISSNPNS